MTSPWQQFIENLAKKDVLFEQVKHASNRRDVVTAAGITDPIGVAFIETEWCARLKVSPERPSEASSAIAAADPSRTTAPLSFVMPAEGKKKRLDLGSVAAAYGGLMARSHTIDALRTGLATLARNLGVDNVDKKGVPLLAVGACSGAGKTEFLRWVFNECCSFSSPKGSEVETIIEIINGASPKEAPTVKKLVVLFASFNQTSQFQSKHEPDVECAVVQRLLRSANGNVRFEAVHDPPYKINSIIDVIDAVSPDKSGGCGVILCIDELPKLSQTLQSELLDRLLAVNQGMLSQGRFVAVVATSLQYFSLGEIVMSGSQRPMHPLPLLPSETQQESAFAEMETRARAMITRNIDGGGNSADEKRHLFQTEVALSVLRHSEKIELWGHFAELAGNTNIPVEFDMYSHETLQTNGIPPEVFFNIVACSWGHTPVPTSVSAQKPLIEVMTRYFNARVTVVSKNTSWDQLHVAIHLPPWRLVQMIFLNNVGQAFPQLHNWVLITLRHFFYGCSEAELMKYWELGTMAVLELRRAMLWSARNSYGVYAPVAVTLRDVLPRPFFSNVSDELLDSKASTVPTRLIEPERLRNEQETPAIYHSRLSNEAGVEGYVTGYGNVSLFYQMKLYTAASPAQVVHWLVAAHARVGVLEWGERPYIVLLFVTGVIDKSLEESLEHGIKVSKGKAKKFSTRHEEDEEVLMWPKNSIVITNSGMSDLFHPFGAGAIQILLEAKKRERDGV